MEVLYPNPVSLLSGSHSMESFPPSNAQTTPLFTDNYAYFFDNHTQTNFHIPSNPTYFPPSYGVFSSTNQANHYFVNNTQQQNNVFFANNLSSWSTAASDERRGIKRKSYAMEVDPDIVPTTYQKKTRSSPSCPQPTQVSTSSLPTSDDNSKQIILYHGSSSTSNDNNNNNFLKTLFESHPINFFPTEHIMDPETKKALIQVGKPTILSVWDTPDDSEPEQELIKSPRIVELTEDDLDTGEEHIKKVPKVIEADTHSNGNHWDNSSRSNFSNMNSNNTPTVTLPVTPPSSPQTPHRSSSHEEELEENEEELIVDDLGNVVRISKPNHSVVIEEIHDEPQPADTESYQYMDIE